MAETLSELLRFYRERAGLSQFRLGVAAGLHDQSFISRVEAGTRKPTRATLDALCDALKLGDADAAKLTVAAGYWPGEHGAILALDALHAARAAGVGAKWG
jgi:transcriptional regulator with XRE-family HTH domain